MKELVFNRMGAARSRLIMEIENDICISELTQGAILVGDIVL